MKILIRIQSDSELIGYEAAALAFALATFGHEIRLFLTHQSYRLLQDSHSRLYGMIQSLELYDIPQAYHDFVDVQLDTVIWQNLTDQSVCKEMFDSVLEF